MNTLYSYLLAEMIKQSKQGQQPQQPKSKLKQKQNLHDNQIQQQQSSVSSSQQQDSSNSSQNVQINSQQIQNTIKTLNKFKKLTKKRKLTELKTKNKNINNLFKKMNYFFNIKKRQKQKCKKQLQKLKQLRKIHFQNVGIRKRAQKFLNEINKKQLQQNQSQQYQNIKYKQLQQQQQFSNPQLQQQVNSKFTQLSKMTCYICKQKYSQIHHFYNCLCIKCANFNYQKRHRRSNLSNITALVTGARIKIGFQIALRLLRDGAIVYCTSRFFNDTYLRYNKEKDYDVWKDRLFIIQCDFTSSEQVNRLIQILYQKCKKIDILINNAAQTIVRPKQFYLKQIKNQYNNIQNIPQHILQLKSYIHNHNSKVSLQQRFPSLFLPETNNHSQIGKIKSKQHKGNTNNKQNQSFQQKNQNILQIFNTASFQSQNIDHNIRDQFDQPIDKRKKNTWRQKIQDVSLMDCYTTQLVNSIVPFHLISKLKPLMKKSKINNNKNKQQHKQQSKQQQQKNKQQQQYQNNKQINKYFNKQNPSKCNQFIPSFIINVSSMQGVFYRKGKQQTHPHTNMAKAALNMITRTCSKQFAKNDNIYMNSVDTGWVTQQNPFNYKGNKYNNIPLDCVDGAMRVIDPIYQAINHKKYIFGKFIKDYKQSTW